MTPHIGLRLAAFFAAVLLMCSCAKKPDDTIKIGIAMAQTGTSSMLGRPTANGVLIAIDEWNARGGVLGKKIVAISRDDENKPDKAVTVAQDLVNSGVVAVIGHVNSGCTIPASPVYYQNKIIQITPVSSNPKITEQGFNTLFRLTGRDDQQAKVAADFIRHKLGVEKLAIIHDKTAYGQGLAEEVQKCFLALGGQTPVFTGVNNMELDFRGNIAQIKDAGVQAVFWGGIYSQTGPFIMQLRQSGLKIPFVTGHGSFMKNTIESAGSDTSDVYLTFEVDWKNLPSAQAFLKNYRAKYGEEGPYSVNGYDAANIVLSAIAQAGTTEAAKVADVMRTRTFPGTLGSVQFDSKGDLRQVNFVVWTIKDGQFQVLP